MTLLYIILSVLGASVVLTVSFRIYERYKLKKRIKLLWNKRESLNDSDVLYEKHYNYFVNQMTYEDTDQRYIVDDVTWKDMNLDDLFRRIDYCFTTIGQELLYSSLRNSNDFDVVDESQMEKFKIDPFYRESVSYQLAKLSKSRNSNTSKYMYQSKSEENYNPFFIFTSFLPVLSIPLFIISPFAAVIGFLTGLAVNIYMSHKHKNSTSREYDDIFYSMMIIDTAGKMNADLRHPAFKKLSYLGPLFVSDDHVGELNMTVKLFITLKSLFMIDYHMYHMIIRDLKKHQELYRKCWHYTAALDVNYSTALWRESTGTYSHPGESTEETINTKGLYHPLLTRPVPNDFKYSKDILLTGSNASGKSTFMRSVALNIITGNGLNTTTSTAFNYKKGMVISSMDISDSVIEGDSYFISEVKSLKRIVDEIEDFDGNIYCIIDEIFKGTNTVERVAAAESFLEYLNKKPNVFVLAATHDMELTKLLKGRFDFYHFSEQMEDDEIYFDYTLKPGAASTTNAIELLRLHGFPDEVYKKAKEKVT